MIGSNVPHFLYLRKRRNLAKKYVKMKISKIETYVLSNKLEQSFFFSQWAYDERKICVIKLTTDKGIYGWGEGYGPAEVIQQGIALLKPLLIGSNPLENESIWFEMYRKTLDFARRSVLFAAISAIDIALWDIKGKALKLPVSTLLGGQYRKKVVPYATGLYFSESKTLLDDLVAEAQDYVSQGFKAIKMKVGLSIKDDLHHVKNVRAAIGPDIQLMVDSNHAYSLREALELARKIEPYDISWFEEPVSPEFYDQYAQLRNKTSIPIAGGECEYLRYGFLQLFQNQSVDIAQIEICASGGLTEAKRIGSLASSFGVEVIPHVWGTGIGFHAALHFIANIEPLPGRLFPPDIFIEYDRTENAIRDRLTLPAVQMNEGYIDIPQTPGLGIDIDPAALKEFSTTT